MKKIEKLDEIKSHDLTDRELLFKLLNKINDLIENNNKIIEWIEKKNSKDFEEASLESFNNLLKNKDMQDIMKNVYSDEKIDKEKSLWQQKLDEAKKYYEELEEDLIKEILNEITFKSIEFQEKYKIRPNLILLNSQLKIKEQLQNIVSGNIIEIRMPIIENIKIGFIG
jgi:hypothetical protein